MSTLSLLDQISSIAPVRQRRAVLDHDKIITLPTESYEILPSLGENYTAFPLNGIVRMGWVADYTNINAAALFNIGFTSATLFGLNEGSFSAVSQLLAGGGPDGTQAHFIRQQSILAAYTRTLGMSGFYDSDLINEPIIVSINNAGDGDLEGGDPDNKLFITLNFLAYNIETGLFE